MLLTVAGIAALIASFVAAIALAGGPATVAEATGMNPSPVGALLALTCALPVALAGWTSYHWLSRRARARQDAEPPPPASIGR